MSNDFRKHMQLIENINVREDDEFDIDPEETLGVDDYSGDFDLDGELDMEIASVNDSEDYVGDEIEEPELAIDDEEVETVEPVYNYTATIQVHGYDFPLVLQSDDMDEIKTVMRVLKQSGLNPSGDYKWNSKTFEIDLDENSDTEADI